MEGGHWLKRLANRRRLVQIGLGVGVYFLVSSLGISLWWVVGFGSLLGKFFCRWMCPLGAVMETITGAANQDGMYMYFKVGCPIAWISGWLNRVSALRVTNTEPACAHCSKCDEACYVVKHNPAMSLHDPAKKNPSTHYACSHACSRCLQCVEACPTRSLSVGGSWKDAREIAIR